jgi:ribonuclease P protein component
MLPKKHRFVKEGDFKKIFARGRRVRGQYTQLVFMKNRFGYNRIAVVVSTKVSKKAVLRNTLRRRVYEHVRRRLLDMQQGVDCVVRVFPAAVDAPRKEFNQSIEALLLKAGLFSQESKKARKHTALRA